MGGGHSLFDFNNKIHDYIKDGSIDISEWHKVLKIIFRQMVECLNYLHNKKSVCHFDISLENFLINDIDVMFDENMKKLKFVLDEGENVTLPQIKLCDFGLAEFMNKNDRKVADFRSTKYCGKRSYQSPEIADRKVFDAQKNDVFGLGVRLFMMMTGNKPFNASNDRDEQFKLIMDEQGDIRKLIKQWNKEEYINDDLVDLFKSIFQSEDTRADIVDIAACNWLK